MEATDRAAIAIAAHPDDIEFTMAGTLCLLGAAGYRLHYVNIASGSCGSLVTGPAATSRIRRRESRRAAAIMGACFHESRTNDLEILYALPEVRWLAAIIRQVRPSIVLTHSPQDYMADHENTCRLAVTAAFARGMPNFKVVPSAEPWSGDLAIYHAMPHGLCDQLRQRVEPGCFVDISSMMPCKMAALACHDSQHGWLKASQGMNSYLREMKMTARIVGRMSRRYRYAEGWRRHAHMGFSARGWDPLREALGRKFMLNERYERRLVRG